MEKTEHIFEYINRLKIKIPTKDEFQELSKMFPIDPCSSDSGIVNFERGMLLYGLIAINKPKTVLEIGTAEGYSTLCMAWAMTDYNIPGIIITIDPKSHNAEIERPTLSYNEKDHGVRLSRKELWEKYADKKWIEKIKVITGFSHDVLRNEKQLAIDFAFIDGSHVFEAVKNDFFLVLRSASNKFQILFDDYNPDNEYGVKKLIEEEVKEKFEVKYIETNAKKQRENMLNTNPDELIMCYINSESLKKPLWDIYSENEIDIFLRKYALFHKRLKARKNIEKKIPFLKKVRFRWWVKN
jgi:predicted O-methyltransferase YrrM|tara:strand:+ start:6213 stop:7103 length:891 start_codon:yes stop_codon:yes gene_type:complete